jgi:hypothetical protein
MKTRRLTKKYKNKRNRKSRKSIKSRNSRKIKNKSRKRILKGGMFEIEKKEFIQDFFENLVSNKTFPQALCALHTFYTCGIRDDEINEVISSEEFKRKYDATFFRDVRISNAAGGFQVNIEAREKLILFLSYIFKKIAEGENIICDTGDKESLYFTPGSESFLKILKKFFGYLDTACVLTISFSIDKKTFKNISQYKKTRNESLLTGISNGQVALYDLYTNLLLLAEKYPTMKKDIDELLKFMVQYDDKREIHSINFNTTNMCTLIKMNQKLFGYFDEPALDEPTLVEPAP